MGYVSNLGLGFAPGYAVTGYCPQANAPANSYYVLYPDGSQHCLTSAQIDALPRGNYDPYAVVSTGTGPDISATPAQQAAIAQAVATGTPISKDSTPQSVTVIGPAVPLPYTPTVSAPGYINTSTGVVMGGTPPPYSTVPNTSPAYTAGGTGAGSASSLVTPPAGGGGSGSSSSTSGSGALDSIMSWITANPLLAGGIGLGVVFLVGGRR